jgi:hypothetical protein
MSPSIDGISLKSFSQPISIDALRKSHCSMVPSDFGIYLIMRTSDRVPNLLPKSTGGWFKGRDPNCLPEFVRTKWVPGAYVVYVGKAAGRKGLKRRLKDLIAFGYGEAVGHWGGRLLWHLPEKEKLVVRWRICSAKQADSAETDAIRSFKAEHDGKRPYANLRK